MKYIICLFSVILLSSCTASFKESVPGSDISIRKFNYEGHSYLEFKPLYYHGSTVIHDPNCFCYD